MDSKYYVSLSILLLVLMFSCKNKNKNEGEDEPEPILEPGFFALTEIRTYKAENVQPYHVKWRKNVSSYNLGSIKSSKEFYFLLTNGGRRPIFDVELFVGREDIALSPQTMDILPSNSNLTYTSGTSFIPLLAIGVIHGTALEGQGVSTPPLQSPETQYIDLEITGKTLKGNDTISIVSQFEFLVTTEVFDFEVYAQDNVSEKLDFNDNYSSTVIDSEGSRTYTTYELYSCEENITFENTGNVDITFANEDDTLTVSPQGKITLSVDNYIYFNIDADNTLIKDAKVKQKEDGTYRFSLRKRCS